MKGVRLHLPVVNVMLPCRKWKPITLPAPVLQSLEKT